MSKPDSDGVMHGPYPGIDEFTMQQYVLEACGYAPAVISEELAAVAQSKHQYEQHCESVKDAIRQQRITAGIGHFMMAKTLKPWDLDLRLLSQT